VAAGLSVWYIAGMRSVGPCAGCGLEGPGGAAGCHSRYEALLALEFGNALFFRVHRVTVDAYSLQHPEHYCASAISFAAHLTGLFAAMEHEDPRAVNARVQRWLSSRPRLDKPALPLDRGRLTIANVKETGDPVAYAREVEDWGRATWDAYRDVHALAREWTQRATEQAGRTPIVR